MFLTALVLRQKLLSLTLSHSHTNNCFLRALNYQAIKHYEEGKKQLLKIPKVFFFTITIAIVVVVEKLKWAKGEANIDSVFHISMKTKYNLVVLIKREEASKKFRNQKVMATTDILCSSPNYRHNLCIYHLVFVVFCSFLKHAFDV